jgi:hypothetical protein
MEMDVYPDFAELCSLLNESNVEYLIVGGYAVGFHGSPRFTGDLDLLVRPDVEHVARMLTGLSKFGFPIGGVTSEYLLAHQKILQLGRIPVQVHLMTAVSGLTWEEAWSSRQAGSYGETPVFFIGRDALLTNKRASGRLKDLADVEALTRMERTE